MPNQLSATGLVVKTYDELVAQYTASFQAIYGNDINLSSDTPDGQMMNIWIQEIMDMQDLLIQIYNSFDPDNAIGEVLDQRVSINGIQRQAGTHTVTPITIVNSQSVNLYGLDQDLQPVYTVSDNAGNNFKLQTTQLGLATGSHVLNFQAENPGKVLTIPNTITVPVSIILGITSINNPSAYTTLGVDEESDAVLKVRRQKSVSLSSQGYKESLEAALKNINGVTAATVYENNTDTTDGDGLPSHSIWTIVSGSGSPSEIANAIYIKRNAGCGMKGSQSYPVVQPDGTIFMVYWDNQDTEDLFIKFNVSSIDGINAPNPTEIKNYLVSNYILGVYEEVNINQLATLVQQLDPNALVTGAGFSETVGGTYTDTLTPSAKNYQFIVLFANINITVV